MPDNSQGSTEPVPLPTAPYPGLRAFREEESGIFFGRRRQYVRMINILKRQHFLAVVGTSGCGKSSLVKAGLISDLDNPKFRLGRQRDETGPPREWTKVVARPGGGPFRNLATELAAKCPVTDAVEPAHVERTLRSGSDGLVDAIYSVPGLSSRNVLIVIDQFEEIFRFGDTSQRNISELERTDLHDDALAFVDTLLSAVDARNPQIYVVITMRSDSLGRCDLFHGLPEAITRSQFLPPRMTKEQLLDAIRKPAELFGATIEDEVVSDLLEAMGDRQDQLPVIQHALAQLWEFARPKDAQAQAPRQITTTHAEACRRADRSVGRLGWVTDAISTHADRVYDSLDEERQRVARAMFCALSQIDNTEEPERRLSSIDEVSRIVFGEQVTDQQRQLTAEVADAFSQEGHNFVFRSTTAAGKEALDISHESLLRHWSALKSWLEKETQAKDGYLRLLDAVNGSVQELDEVSLARAIEWRDTVNPQRVWAERYAPKGADTGKDTTRLAECLTLIRHSEDWHKKQKEKAKRLEQQAQTEREQRLKEQAEAEAKRASMIRRWLVAMSAVAVLAVLASFAAITARGKALVQESLAIQAAEDAEEERIKADEAREDAEGQRREALKAKAAAESHRERSVRLLYASRITAAQSAWESGNKVRAWSNLRGCQWDLRGWEHDYLYSTFTAARNTLGRHSGSVMSVNFSPDGTRIVSGSDDNTVKVWDASSGEETLTLAGHSGSVWSVNFSPDGTRIVSGSDDNTVKVWLQLERLLERESEQEPADSGQTTAPPTAADTTIRNN